MKKKKVYLIDRIACCPECNTPLIIRLNVLKMPKEQAKMLERFGKKLVKSLDLD